MKYLLATLPALLVIGAFLAFAHWVPQVGWKPEVAAGLSPEMTPPQLAQVGERLFKGRGCTVCHVVDPAQGWKAPPRAPNLWGIGARSDVAYIVESLYSPQAKVVEGYAPIMPAATNPPANLNYEEVVAVVNYLLSLGGRPSVRIGDIPRPPGGQ
ncbi:MAG: c-type cytochrome [Dehalococcoidia bacterium]